MPYKIMKDGDQWCVHKEDGDRIGCHDSEAKAKRQMAALYANEGSHKELTELKLDMFRQFNQMMDELDSLPVQHVTDLVSEKLAEQAAEAVHEHDHAAPTTLYAAPDSNDTNILKALAGKFRQGLKPGQSVFKGHDGKRLMLIVTSSSYKDRENETLTSEALKADVDRHWTQGDDAFMSNNKLLYWHDDDIPLGDVVWGDFISPFYVELAREDGSPISKAYFDYREQHPGEKWGASHRFAYWPTDRNDQGDYARIFKQETTTLPLDAAANLTTISEVLPMTDKRGKKFDELVGLDGAYDLIKTEGLNALVQRMQAQGVEHKAEGEAETPPPDAGAQIVTLVKALTDVIDDQGELDERVDKAVTDFETKSAALDEKLAELSDLLSTVKGLQEKLQEQTAAKPRSASRATETIIENQDLPDGVADSLLIEDPVFGKVLPLK